MIVIIIFLLENFTQLKQHESGQINHRQAFDTTILNIKITDISFPWEIQEPQVKKIIK
jgi:hypothetical protein